MIESPTILILGAGASIPYGFPSGEQLRDEICSASKGEVGKILQTCFRFEFHEVVRFCEVFQDSNVKSIDSFLSRNERYTAIGKAAISVILCRRENRDAFRKFDRNIDDHWYFEVWDRLIEDVVTVEELKKNKIKFITFNYDRSLEYFLFQSVKNTFCATEQVALDVVKHFDILHVYGTLGEFGILDNWKNGILKYATISSPDSYHALMIAAHAIKIMPEARENSVEFERAHTWLREAVRIGFLGFGFDSLNVLRLGLAEAIRERLDNENYAPSVFASVLGRTKAEIRDIQNKVGAITTEWNPWKEKCTMTIRESGILLK